LHYREEAIAEDELPFAAEIPAPWLRRKDEAAIIGLFPEGDGL